MLEKLQKLIGKEHVYANEPMRNHTTFRTGGCARFFVEPQNAEQIRDVILCCKEQGIPFCVVGNGSNLLVSDQGYDGVIIHLFKNMSGSEIRGSRLITEAGILLSKAASIAARAGLGGLEFASGIPGTVGGALVMNAGAYGGEMKDVVRSVQVLAADGNLQEYTGEEMEFSYRRSRIAGEGSVVLKAELELHPADPEQIRARMEELKEQRIRKQPLEYASAGSTFKRPEGHFAGKLIEEAGLRGFAIGDAQVSEKHCGFVINRGKASAAQVAEVIAEVQRRVLAHSGVHLETEVKFLGDFTKGR